MFCGKCGAKIETGVKFCSDCGQPTAADLQEHMSAQNSVVINYIEAKVRFFIAISINIAVAVMFILPWLDIGGLSLMGSITGLPIGKDGGVTITSALSVISKAFEPAKTSGGSHVAGLIFLQVFLVALLATPAINVLSAFMLFIKKQRARAVLFFSGVYTLTVSALFIIFVFIYNAYLSNDTSGLAPTLMGITLKAPAYVTAILGLASVFSVPKVSTANEPMVKHDIEAVAKETRHREKMSGLAIILPLLAFFPTLIAQRMYMFFNVMFIGALGDYAVVSTRTAGTIMNIWTLSSGILGYIIFLIVDRFSDNPKKRNAIFLAVSAVSAVIITILAQALKTTLARSLTTSLGSDEQIVSMCGECTSIAIWGILAVITYNALAVVNIVNGRKISPFIFIIIAVVLNIVLAWLLLSPITMGAMGIGGVSIATLIAQVVSAVLYAIYTFTRKKTVEK